MSFLRNLSVPVQLRKSEFTDALPKVELRQLDEIARFVKVPEGRTIITQATTGSKCFVVVDGMFAVKGPSVDTTARPGDVAGELALLTGKECNASVVATIDSTVYAMRPGEFAELLSKAPTFRRQVVSSANARLGSESETVSAQFAPKVHGQASTASWSERLAEMPRWQPIS